MDDNNNDDNNIIMETSNNIQSLHTLPKRHFYLTRRGKILQSTTENYLRDDLGYGTLLVPDGGGGSGSKSGKSSKKSNETIAGKIISLVPHTIVDVRSLVNILLLHSTTTTTNNNSNISDVNDGKKKIRLVIVDTNILLHHMDVLEYLRNDDDDTNDDDNNKHYAIANAIIIPQTALNEVRHRSLVMYRRATDLVRSSSGGSGSSGSDDDSKEKKKKRKRCVIVFADVHHVDTQIITTTTYNNNSTSSTEYDGATMSSSINDENDARLRKVAYFYGRAIYNHGQHQHDYQDQDQDQGDDNYYDDNNNSNNNNIEVVFLSDDVQSRKLSLLEQPKKSEGNNIGSGGLYYNTRSMRNHVQILQNEDPTLNLLDMVAQFNSSNNNTTEGGGGGGGGSSSAANANTTDSTSRLVYTPHITSSKLSSGLQTNMYYQGIYHSNRDSCTEGYVTIIRRGNDNNNDDERVAIVISGSDNINRAVDGDIVAVELYSVDCWLGGSGNNSNKDDDDNGQVKKKKKMMMNEAESGIAADTAEPTVRDMENITEEVMVIMNDDDDKDKNDDGGQLPTLRRPTVSTYF